LYELKQIPTKRPRQVGVNELFEQIYQQYCPISSVAGVDSAPKFDKVMVKRVLEKIEGEVVRKMVLEGRRCDGRRHDELRPISCVVGILPRNHGSALFTRGETQALVSVTLGTIRDAQIIDGLLEEYAQNFTVHYNFPPFSVGEIRPVRGPGRREIGHGVLAERALERVRPSEDEFAYTVRIVSDITESNGSSSMASVCGGTLALMDAGVPIKRPVAGISIGMVSDETGRHELLTDITGDEDHFGDMDFKVAGTVGGITAIQLDIKAEGLPYNIMVEALERAKVAWLKILEIMAGTISGPRPELSVYAPKLTTLEIDPSLIGKVIGPGGKMIKSIQEQTGATIEVEEDGTIYISCWGGDGHLKAKDMIESLTQPPQVGRIYDQSKVVSVKDFGVFVEISPGVEGLCHISELSDGFVRNAEDVCKVGDLIPVKLLAIDDQGRFKLSRKAALVELSKEKEKDKQRVGEGK
jgi:polyribonucleotide nucleotidyltransferase